MHLRPRASRARPAAAAWLLLPLAVLAAAVPPSPPGELPTARAAADAPSASSTNARPSACDAGRPALVHRPGGAPADPGDLPVPIPCFAPTGFDSWEPTIGIHPRTGEVFFATSYVGQDPPDIDPTELGRGVARSSDQGATWQLLRPHLAGVPTHPTSEDPFLYVDPATGRVFLDDLLTLNCATLSYSDDRGESWDHTVSGCTQTDHQTLFAGPPAAGLALGQPLDYPNVVYRCSINAGLGAPFSLATTCNRSLDGGRTWVPTGEPPYYADPSASGHQSIPGLCDGGVGHGVVGPDGTVYLPKGWCRRPFLAMSHDEGLTWERVQVSDLGTPITADGGVDHEANVAVDRDGNLYYAWVAQDRMPYLTVSTDGGRTWSDEVPLAPPGLKEASLSQLAVGAPGRAVVTYMGSPDSPGAPFAEVENCFAGVDEFVQCVLPPQNPGYENTTWNGYMTILVDALDPQPLLMTATVNDPADPLARGTCGPIRCEDVGDFLDVQVGPDGTPWGAFVDACQGACASGEEVENNDEEGAVGWLRGGPSLLEA